MTITSTSAITNINEVPATTTLQAIANKFGLSTYWVSEQEKRGSRVARYRKYYDGDHDLPLDDNMRKLLRVQDSDDGMAVNLMPSVVDSKADRCIVQSIEGVEEEKKSTPDIEYSEPDQPTKPQDKKPAINDATKWVQDIMDDNDFDVLQDKVHRPAIRDGNNYVMVSWDNEKQKVVLTVEPAWDGQSGMLMVYKSRNINKPYMAIKVWQIDSPSADGNDKIATRINAYFENKIEKYIDADGTGNFIEYVDADKPNEDRTWTVDKTSNMGIGIPVIPFRNDVRENYGVSELRNAIPVQNALNRFHYSSIMAAELTAFPIYFQVGFDRVESTFTPGVIIKIVDAVTKDQLVDFRKIEGSDMTPILDMIESSRRRIAEITRTPSPDLSGGSQQSGEYLKQLEVGLVGKCRRFDNEAGSSWEQVFDMAHKVQMAFGTKKPPAYKRFVCKWKSPEIRNNREIIDNAKNAAPFMGKKQTIRNMGEVFDITNEEQVEKVMQEQAEEKTALVREMGAGVPRFGGDNPPPFGGNGGMNPMLARMGQPAAEMSRV